MATLSPSVLRKHCRLLFFPILLSLWILYPLYTSLACLHNNDSDRHSNSITCSELWNTRWIKHLTTKWDWNLKTVMDDVSCCAFTTASTRFEADIDCTARCEIEFPQLSHTSIHLRLLMLWWFDPRKLHGCVLDISPALVREIDFTFACQKHLCIVYRHHSTGSNWESLLQHSQTIFVFIVTFCLREWEREIRKSSLTSESEPLSLSQCSDVTTRHATKLVLSKALQRDNMIGYNTSFNYDLSLIWQTKIKPEKHTEMIQCLSVWPPESNGNCI